MTSLLPDSQISLETSLARALKNTGASVLYQDRDLRIRWARNLSALWSSTDIAGRTEEDFLPAGQAVRMSEKKRAVLASGVPETFEISFDGEEGTRWFEIWIDPDVASGGEVVGVVTTAVETTEHQRREQTLRALLREVSHRSKNLLAIILSIATQTGRYTGTIETFLDRFRGRIQSLAYSQDLVTSSDWRGADLRELVNGQVARYCADPARNIRLVGANPYLNPNAALHIGLALHELAVNSVSFGALSKSDGFVTISMELIERDSGRPALCLGWTERIAIDARELEQKRFGSIALERVVPASLNGEATLKADGEGLEYRLLIPEGNFEIG